MAILLRGISKVTAAVTGVLLVYSFIFAMESMTTRLPETPLHELVRSTLWMLPWMFLFCSGVEDLGKTSRWKFFTGVAIGFALIYFLDRHTADRTLTKIAMPLAVTFCGIIPHFVRSIRFVYALFSIAVGIAGLVVIYFEASAFLSGSFFPSRINVFIVLIFFFCVSSVTSAALSTITLRTAKPESLHG